MDKATKESLVKEFNEIFTSAVAGVLVDYKGSSVAKLTSLRKILHEQNSKFRVLKNTLAKLALEGTPFEQLGEYLTETRALVYSTEDVASPAKLISKEASVNENLKVIAGILVSGEVGELLDTQGIKQLGDLPSKEELIAKLLFVLNAPITNFVRTLNEVPGSFVRALQAIADSKE